MIKVTALSPILLFPYLKLTSLVAYWSELLTTNHEVPGSIPVSNMWLFP